MRITFFFRSVAPEEVARAEACVAAMQPALSVRSMHARVRSAPEGALASAFHHVLTIAEEENDAFAIFSCQSSWALDPDRLHALLTSDGVRGAAVAVRAGKIFAKAAVFSPKLAYVDSDFIIINVQRCQELGIPERLATVPFASHFTDAGGIHADLLALLETIVPYGALYVYDDGSDLQDLNGEQSGFAVSPYLFSRRFGFVSAVPEQDPRVHALRAALLQRYHLDRARPIQAYITANAWRAHVVYDRDGFPFLAKPILVRCANGLSAVAKRVLGKVNYEIQKTYDSRA